MKNLNLLSRFALVTILFLSQVAYCQSTNSGEGNKEGNGGDALAIHFFR